jgi:uncharacterized protein YdeI (BOF family)
MRAIATTAASLCILGLAAAPMVAAQQQQTGGKPASTQNQANTAKQTAAQNRLAKAANGEWISLTGKVHSASPNQFTLKLGKDLVTVEMDDFDWYKDHHLRAGDKVVVTGRMDKDFHEAKRIEASSVYVPKLNEYFYASAADEEGGYYSHFMANFDWNGKVGDGGWVSLAGTVTSTNGEELTVDTGFRTIQVDTGHMASSPAAKGVDVGDRIAVAGSIDDAELFDSCEIQALSIVVINNNAV